MGDVGLWSVGPDHDDDAAADETDKDRSLPFGFVTTTGLRNGPRDDSLDEAMVRVCTGWSLLFVQIMRVRKYESPRTLR